MVYFSMCFSSFMYLSMFQSGYFAFFLICSHMRFDLVSSHTPILSLVHMAAPLLILCLESQIFYQNILSEWSYHLCFFFVAFGCLREWKQLFPLFKNQVLFQLHAQTLWHSIILTERNPVFITKYSWESLEW